MERANVIIVGGGIVGCAIAAELASRIKDVFVLEELPRVGMATSSRNSGVIHSGVYYPPGSLKAQPTIPPATSPCSGQKCENWDSTGCPTSSKSSTPACEWGAAKSSACAESCSTNQTQGRFW